MSLVTEHGRWKNLNFNSLLHMIGISALVWVGTTVNQSRDRLAKIDSEIAVISATDQSKWDQLNRIETEVNKQRDQLHDLQIEVAKLKNK